MKYFFILCMAILAVEFFAIYYGNHGFRDLIRMNRQIEMAKKRSESIEKENEALRRRLKVLEEKRTLIQERELREFLGWVKSDELVYLESKGRP